MLLGSTVPGKQMTARGTTLEPGGVLMQKVLPVRRSYSPLGGVFTVKSPLKANDPAHTQTSPTQTERPQEKDEGREGSWTYFPVAL